MTGRDAMGQPPQYTIIRKVYADGSEEYRGRIGPGCWCCRVPYSGEACDTWISNPSESYSCVVFKSREEVEAIMRKHWLGYLASLPLITEELHYDPEAL